MRVVAHLHETRGLNGYIEDATLCGCSGQPFKPGPKHALTLEVYRADTLQLLDSNTDNDGSTAVLDDDPNDDDDYQHDLLVRVYSPKKKNNFSYQLTMILVNGGIGDDCEC